MTEPKTPENGMPVLMDVHGSCVSRNIFRHDKFGEVEVGQNFSRNNIVSCMMPPVELQIPRTELHYRSDYAYRCVEYALNKETVPRLLDSEAMFLAVDFFDMCQHVAMVGHTTCQTYDYTILNAPTFKTCWTGKQIHFFEIPTCLWYSYIDLYWMNMAAKYQNNIILSRLSCCGQYLTKNRTVAPLPERVLFFGNEKYNAALAELEQYVIDKYNPYVIDVSKYFISDINYEPDATPVHFEENYVKSAWDIMHHIILNRPDQRYFDCLPSSVTVDLLVRNIPDSDFTKIWQKRKKPFSSFAFLDDVFLWLNDSEVIGNRHWIASLYQFFEGIGLDAPAAERIEKILSFTDWLGKNEGVNEFQREVVDALKAKTHYFEMSPETLFAQFLSAFNGEDLQWIQMLSCLHVMMPDDPQVANFREQYRKCGI